jgi:hypothetical protein
MAQLIGTLAAVEAHSHLRVIATGVEELADLFEPEEVGPEMVGFLHIVHVQDQMVDPHWGHRLTSFGLWGVVAGLGFGP